MEKNIIKVAPQKVTPPSDIPTDLHEKESCSSVSAEKIIESCDNKISPIVCKETDILNTLAQGVPIAKAPTEADAAAQQEDEDEIVLLLQSSDEETFDETIGDVAELKRNESKNPAEGRLEKYFSDIESSDNSQEYEPRTVPVEVVEATNSVPDEAVVDAVEAPGNVSTPKETILSRKEVKVIELEFEPVESDEEDFEESPPLDEGSTATQVKENLSEVRPPSEVEDVSKESEVGRSTPLFDEEKEESDDQGAVEFNKNGEGSTASSQVAEGDDKEVVAVAATLLEEGGTNESATVHTVKQAATCVTSTKVVAEGDANEQEKETTVDLPNKGRISAQESVGGSNKFADTQNNDKQEVDDSHKISSGAKLLGSEESLTKKIEASTVSVEVPRSPRAREKIEVREAMEVDIEAPSFEGEETVTKEKKPVKENIKIEGAMEVDIEVKSLDGEETGHKEKESVLETLKAEQVDGLLEEIFHDRSDTNTTHKKEAEEEVLTEGADKSQNTNESSEGNVKTKHTDDKSQATGEKSEVPPEAGDKSLEQLLKPEKNSKTSTEDENLSANDKSLENVVITTEKCLESSENSTEADNCPKTADECEKSSKTPSDAEKSLEATKKSKESMEETIETKKSQEQSIVSAEDEKPEESLVSAEESHEIVKNLTERQESIDTAEKTKEGAVEVETSKGIHVVDIDKSTAKSGSRETAEKLHEVPEKAADCEMEISIESAHKSALKSVNLSAEDSTKERELHIKCKQVAVDKTAMGEALQKILDDLKPTHTKDYTSDVKAEQNLKAKHDTDESEKSKAAESEVMGIDHDDGQDKKQGNSPIHIAKTSSTVNDVKKELKENDPTVEVIKSGNDATKRDSQTVEDKVPEADKQQSDEEKQKENQLTIIQTEAEFVEKPSESTVETKKIDESVENPEKEENVEMLEIIETSDNDEAPEVDTKPKEDLSIKDDTTMKSVDNTSAPAVSFDDEEPLLMIDTAHKEENEYNDMDTETEQTATSAPTTDSSSDGSLEVFYDKECVNYECKHGSKNYYRATLFSLNYYKISKKRSKAQFACEECYDRALDSYEQMCRTLKQKQPLLHGATFKGQEYVEIIDSSDEDESDGTAEKFKDENTLPKESIQLLEAELEGAIRKVMHNVEIQNQLSWTKQILQQRLKNLEEDTEFVSEQLRLLQKKADNMHNSLYQCPKIKIRQLTPLDLNSGRSYNPETESTIPPMGEVLRTNIHLNETYYAVKNKAIASWVPCKVIEAIDGYLPHSKNLKHYKIKFLKSKYPMLKTVSAKHMAFFNPPKVRLPIGTRVIAYFDATSLSRGKEKMLIPSAFYPGIIAEPLKQSNKFRYLVFYDDGYFQYVYHKDVRLVCQASEQVWEDVHHQSREFIHNYLTQYAVNRPMVQTQKGQSMLVDYNGKWIYARVIDVDCSLVQMLFEGQSRSEWIYRGSTRLGPVYKESNNLVQKNQWGTSRIPRRTEPFIRYFNGDDTSSSQQLQESQQQKPGEVRSVAKKSVSRTDTSQSSQPIPAVRHLNNSTIFVDDDNKPKGKVVYYTARKNLPPRDYVQHICNPSCPFTITHNLLYYSPLAKPLLSGWERQVFRQKSKKFIVYRGPCGKRMRSMEELHRYLRVTDNDLNVDNFDFSPETNCLAEYVIESCIVQKKDISNGKEKMPIPCVNYYDNTMPPDCIYSSRRIPTEGVPLNLDRDFLVGCDCEDDCSDKAKCSCWELTYAGAKYGMPNVPNEMVGYQYKRLYEHVPTGIYECNSRCKCKANCVNRVVQQPLQSKLQVFKTSNRGWGLRCINDVPRGSFICVYAGHLLTEQKANEGGLDAGDEYFAELDYIEVAEQIKEGYESDVVEPDEDEELYNPEKEDEDDDEFVAPSESHRNKAFNTRLRTRRSTKNSTDAEHDSQERQVISFEPNKTMGQPDNSTSEKPTIRKLFGKDEACYIMDAKITGNLGRYFNHSCSPNLFVQNVFVDTHDLRFPWVAFFAFTHIRAGTELTWNYNYEVGVVPGKVLYCQCGAPNCRQRLL